MSDWDNLRGRIQDKDLDSPTWLSDKQMLLIITAECEKLNLDPGNASRASISNLRTIIKPLRKAIENHDLTRIDKLFDWAADQSNRALRSSIGMYKAERVNYWLVRKEKNESIYLIEVNSRQLKRIMNSVKDRLDLHEQRKPIK